MKTFIIALTLVISTFAHAEESTENFLSEIGVSADVLNENGKALITQETQQADESGSLERAPTPAPGDEINVNELKILGRGFVDRNTGDSLALAFYTGPSIQYKNDHMEHCTRLRHVLFEASTMKAYYIGNDYLVTCGEEASPQLIKSRLKEMNREFKTFRRSQNHNRNFYIFGGGGIALAPIVWFTSPASWMVAAAGGMPPVLAVYSGALIVWCVVASIYNSNDTLFARSAGGSSTILIDQNGWNWSSKPKKVSHRTFSLYRKFIR
jgi:hypothetical protein